MNKPKIAIYTVLTVALIGILIGIILGILRNKDIKTSVSIKLDFPVTLLSTEEIKKRYVMVNHTLSPFPEYHFQLALEKDWKTIDTIIKDQIKKGDTIFHVAGLFQKRNSESNPVAEIDVSIAKVEIDKPLTPLKDIVVQEYGSHLVEIVNYETIGKTGQDILFTFKNNQDKLTAARMYSFSDPKGRVFRITGVAPANSYNQFAQDFFSAMATFAPIN